MIRVVIYNTNSFGGNFEYSRCLHEAYSNNAAVTSCKLLLPSNSILKRQKNLYTFLEPDIISSNSKLLKKVYFVYRSLLNPIKLFGFLLKEKKSLVIFNDYDQLTSFVWRPLFQLYKKHVYGVVLHDPNRDKFFKITLLSNLTMKWVTKAMHFGICHSSLPDKSYYPADFQTVIVPHGIYPPVDRDDSFFEALIKFKAGSTLISILGNLREDKNYEAVLQIIGSLTNTKLLIAGKAANSSFSIQKYQTFIEENKLQKLVLVIPRYLSAGEFAAALEATDISLLFYKDSFQSQSGLLNALAPYKKKLIVSDTPSPLLSSVSAFNLGLIVSQQNLTQLQTAIESLTNFPEDQYFSNWENYQNASKWQEHVNIVLKEYQRRI